MTIEKKMLDALIQHQVYNFRLSTRIVNEINAEFARSSNQFTSKLRDLLDELTDSEKEALILGKYTTDTLKEIKTAFDEWGKSISMSLPELFGVSAIALASYETSYISKLYGKEKEIDGAKIYNQAKKLPIVGGELFGEIWKNLDESTRKKALYAVREGIQNGLTTAEIVAEIKGKRTKVGDGYEYVGGIVDQTKNQLDSAVRTIRSHVAQIAYDATFEALGFEYVKFLATIDFRTSLTCSSLDQTFWKRGDENIRRPPLHFRCRSVLVGVDGDGRMDGMRPFVRSDKPVSKMSKDERVGNIGQIDANDSFSTWLSRQPKRFQLEYLGKTKYELYSKGGYSLSKFVDPLGKEYSIRDLKMLDAETFRDLGL